MLTAEKVLLSSWVRFFLLPLGSFICALTPNEWRSQGFSLWQEKVNSVFTHILIFHVLSILFGFHTGGLKKDVEIQWHNFKVIPQASKSIM